MTRIGIMASEEMSFENVDDGRLYKINVALPYIKMHLPFNDLSVF